MNQKYDSVNCFTLILCGESYLNHTLSKQIHESLKQRITVHYDFTGLSDEEAVRYIIHKLESAGSSKTIIEEAALMAIAGHAHGNPRTIMMPVQLPQLCGSMSPVNQCQMRYSVVNVQRLWT